MKHALMALVLSASQAQAQIVVDDTKKSAFHIGCSAFFSMSAWHVHVFGRDRKLAHDLANRAELSAITAIRIGVSEDIPAWVTRDAISDLTARLKVHAADSANLRTIADQYEQRCFELYSNLDN